MTRRGWAAFAAMSVIWGMPYLFIKVADGGVSVPVLVFTRLAVAAALLLPLAIRGRQIAGLWRHWRWLVLFAIVEMIIPWALLSDAERHLSSSMTGLLVASVPIIGVVLARLTGGPERLTAARWTGLLIGLAGVAVLAGVYLVTVHEKVDAGERDDPDGNVDVENPSPGKIFGEIAAEGGAENGSHDDRPAPDGHHRGELPGREEIEHDALRQRHQ